MNYEDIQIRYLAGIQNSQPGLDKAEAAIRAALERDRVVGVLDAAIRTGTIRSWQMTHHVGMGDFAHAIWLSPGAQVFYGSDFDAARAAAAKAIEEKEV